MNLVKPQHISETILAELEHFGTNFQPAGSTRPVLQNEAALVTEPFIGYMEVKTGAGDETYLLCRNYTPLEIRPKGPALEFASYLAPIGALFAHRVGSEAQVRDRLLSLVAKNQFSPTKGKSAWDAIKNKLESEGVELTPDSLRDFLLYVRKHRPGTQSISDEQASESDLIPIELNLRARRSLVQVTMLPDRAILDETQDPIFRHPLAGGILITGAPGTGKTTVQVKRLAQKTKWDFLTEDERSGLNSSAWTDNLEWLFFTPTPLLKGYLKEALAKERLAASDANVKVWGDYQLELLRRIGFLRVNENGTGFRRMRDGGVLLRDEASAAVTEFAAEFQRWMSSEIDGFVRNLAGITGAGRSPLAILASKRDSLPKEIREKLSPGQLFRQIPKLLSTFRNKPEVRVKYYRDDANAAISDSRIDQHEMGALLYASLKWVRETWDYFASDGGFRNQGGPGQLIKDERLIVAIDEASDFSAVEVGAMALLASPQKASVSLSGDLMQRLTSTGIRSWDELSLVGLDVKRYELRRAYRQTGRLGAIAGTLYATFSGDNNGTSIPAIVDDKDPPVLVKHAPDLKTAAVWLGERITEIFDLNGGQLPSIGVLLPSDYDLGAFRDMLATELFDSAIDVEASFNGQSLGTASKVRVFGNDHIKGLEFESVFFCDIDVVAKAHADLVDKFVYVGVSRARSFLGMTYRDAFPPKLDVIRPQLSFANRFAPIRAAKPWRSYLDEDETAQFDESETRMLDQFFLFYWETAYGIRKADTAAQIQFREMARDHVAGKTPIPANDHQRVFLKFLQLHRLRA
jgi:hypothetical protein